MADRLRRVGTMDAIDGSTQVHRAGAERIARSAGHETRQIRLALDHFRRGMPVGPLGLAADLQQALPSETVAADTDAVTHRVRRVLDQIEMMLLGIDDDGARRLLRPVEHHLLLVLVRKASLRTAVVDAGVDVRRRRLKLKRRQQRLRRRLRQDQTDRRRKQDEHGSAKCFHLAGPFACFGRPAENQRSKLSVTNH